MDADRDQQAVEMLYQLVPVFLSVAYTVGDASCWWTLCMWHRAVSGNTSSSLLVRVRAEAGQAAI